MFNPFQTVCLDRLGESIRFREAAEFFETSKPWAAARGLYGSAFSYLAVALTRKRAHPFLIVTEKNEIAEEIFEDLTYLGASPVYHYPKWDILPYEEEEPVAEIRAQQAEALDALLRWQKGVDMDAGAPILVTAYDALMQKTLPADRFQERTIRLEWGDTVDTTELARRLALAGYERAPMVESRGEFSIRGGIIDIFPIEAERAIRIDLFGDEIESVRAFDTYTQRSVGEMNLEKPLFVFPAQLNSLVREILTAGEKLVPVTDYLTEGTRLLLHGADNYEATAEKYDEIIRREWEAAQNELAAGQRQTAPVHPESAYLRHTDLQRELGRFQRMTCYHILPVEAKNASTLIEFETAGFESVAPDLNHYLEHIRRRQSEDFLVNIVCDNDGQAMRLREILSDHDIGAQRIAEADKEATSFETRRAIEGYQDVVLTVGALANGFEWSQAHVAFITDREIFGRYKRRHFYRKLYKGAPISSIADIQRNDLVIHVDHGLGRYMGLRIQEVDGKRSEFLEITYDDGGRLLVPIEKVRKVQKYMKSVDEDTAPKLDRLGGKRWENRKKKSQKAVEQMAEELLELYAKRATAQAHSYGDDTVWQTEFEASFIYTETPDQLKAITDTKEDMMSEKPMDRLICGDVGFGKTEVAIRAAFKAVQDGKQVAFLAPTTVLAQQHYKNLSERFADYPLTVDVLSRFRTPAEQKKTIAETKLGNVNVLVGTHRLLSQDVKFADLGLVVIDEEQRFGVKQKEKLKEMRAQVDVLTLSATPIPRTLHMAMSGIRDLSLISTPPADRLPIRTRVIQFDKDQIAEAILRELNRGGQVYFVHNRVHNIEKVAQQIQEIVPRARIAIAHGQMNHNELEQVMTEFVNGDTDILLATTIIENGIDIPNVNTIIINRADAFGLAQLYQLRGRVGRDVKRAYAYLIVPSGQPITDLAVKRLRAIEEFTELGVGFNVAMRDMEIRGVGNILGGKQHGVMEEIGFELYCEMLENAIRKLRGESAMARSQAEVKWNRSAVLPMAYVPVESQRIAIYKRLASAREWADLDDIEEELRDRYGEMPEEAANLLNISRLRLMATQHDIIRIQGTAFGWRMTVSDVVLGDRDALLALVGRAREATEHLEDIKEIKASSKGEINILLESPARARSLALAIQFFRAMEHPGILSSVEQGKQR